MIEKNIRSWFTVTEKKKAIARDLSIMAAVISFVVLIVYVLNDIYPFGDGTIARGDMVQQTIPAGMYYVWDILHGQASPFFTWNSAFGMNISGASSLGALLSPLNLFLYFSTRENLANFANILMILKMIAIAFSMYFYLRKYEVKNIVHMAGGVLYAFGAASLIHFQIMLVMDIAFLLPLLMIGLDRIFEKKGCKFFIFVFALCLMVNVYTGCITLVFLFLSSALRTFWDTEEKAEKRRCALWLGGSVVAAILISAFVSIPALLCVADTPRSGEGGFLNVYRVALENRWSLGEWKTVETMLVNTALPCACILFFLVHGKGLVSEKIRKYKCHMCMTGLLFLSVAVAGVESLWHGGSRASWPLRFVYIISFVLIDFAVVLYQDHKESLEAAGKWIKNKVWIGIGAAALIFSGWLFYGIYHAYCEQSSYSALGDGFLCILVELIFAAVYWCLLKSRAKGVILVLLCVEITCASVISFAPNKDNVSVFSADYLEAANDVAMGMETEIKDFERIKNTDYKVDHIEYSLVLGKEAISNYWHVINPSVQPKFAALGYSINWTQLLDTGGTVFSDTLFNIKYFLSQDDLTEELYDFCEVIDESGDVIQLYKNKFELPFVINTDTSSLSPKSEKFETQNTLFAAVTGSQEKLIQDVSSQIYSNFCEMQIGNEKKILYFYGTNTSDNPVEIKVNGVPVRIPASSSMQNQQYPADFGNGFICLGAFQNETVQVQFSGGVNPSDLHLGMLDYAAFVNGIEKVKKENPKIVSLEQRNSGVDIELEGVTKSNLFLPVSYDEGWECNVNGEKVSDIQNLDGMLSIPVVEGKNDIKLRYTAPGQKAGAVLSICGLLALAAFVFVRKKIVIPEKAADLAGYVAYTVFVGAFIIFFIALFVIPTLFYLRAVFIGTE
ncbi:MAG: YfhO family protein [Eubacterium sp.]|nr:YfhO family protein [Eubacterium sp.]